MAELSNVWLLLELELFYSRASLRQTALYDKADIKLTSQPLLQASITRWCAPLEFCKPGVSRRWNRVEDMIVQVCWFYSYFNDMSEKKAISLLLVLTLSPLVPALMWRYCLSSGTYRSGGITASMKGCGCVMRSPASMLFHLVFEYSHLQTVI